MSELSPPVFLQTSLCSPLAWVLEFICAREQCPAAQQLRVWCPLLLTEGDMLRNEEGRHPRAVTLTRLQKPCVLADC